MKKVEWDDATVRRVRRGLLRWYDRGRRVLPWRGDKPDPYLVLVSEAMLQQTQVATVIGYFERFVARWPTVHDLAAADEQAVLRLWQGLGYYRRARNLHTAAKVIVAEHGGRVPDTVEGLLRLPGVGRYTAGAVASIAFGRRAAAVDGNVMRVLTRWLAITDALDAPATQAKLWAAAQRLVSPARPGDFNQAVMELGAMVCTSRSPGCAVCPVRGMCGAEARSLVEKLPVRAKPQAARRVTHHVVAVERNGGFLFEQRPSAGLWSNMWQMPTAEELNGDTDAAAIRHWMRDHCGIALRSVAPLGRFAHQTTHRAITFQLWRGTVGKASRPSTTRTRVWRALDQLDELPLSKAQQRVVALLMQSPGG